MALANVAGPLLLDLFRRLRPVPNTFTTATHFSRLHLDVAEAAVLAVSTHDFAPPPALARRLGAEEVRGRRALLLDLREAVYAWGGPYWHTWPPGHAGVANAHAA
jgi:hypothetical protein